MYECASPPRSECGGYPWRTATSLTTRRWSASDCTSCTAEKFSKSQSSSPFIQHSTFNSELTFEKFYNAPRQFSKTVGLGGWQTRHPLSNTKTHTATRTATCAATRTATHTATHAATHAATHNSPRMHTATFGNIRQHTLQHTLQLPCAPHSPRTKTVESGG